MQRNSSINRIRQNLDEDKKKLFGNRVKSDSTLELNPESQDDWTILGIPSNSNLETVKRVFKVLAMSWHPDKTDDIAAQEHFIKLKNAHDRLVAKLTTK